jgi:hypothetical protein
MGLPTFRPLLVPLNGYASLIPTENSWEMLNSKGRRKAHQKQDERVALALSVWRLGWSLNQLVQTKEIAMVVNKQMDDMPDGTQAKTSCCHCTR